MKVLLSALSILLFTVSLNVRASSAYQDKIRSFKDFKINGLLFIAGKEDIIKQFGQPQKVFEPNNECGFLSEHEQGKKFYTLLYQQIQFTGNEIDRYQLEEVKFDQADLKVTYKGKSISHQTTKKDFEKIFRIKIDKDEVKLSPKKAEDSLIFYFLNGRLSRMEYWSPC